MYRSIPFPTLYPSSDENTFGAAKQSSFGINVGDVITHFLLVSAKVRAVIVNAHAISR